jgi:hypothetical protein
VEEKMNATAAPCLRCSGSGIMKFLMKRYHMEIGLRCNVVLMLCIGVVFLGFGVGFRVGTSKMGVVEVRYDDKCAEGEECIVPMMVHKRLFGRIALLYRLEGFYQNHRLMFNSRSFPQLKGEYATNGDLQGCEPLIWKDGVERPENLYIPCGLLAVSFFTDYYSFLNDTVGQFSETDIALKVDREDIYKDISPKYTSGIRHLREYPDFPGENRNEHFMVWMRTAAMPDFIKLFARCEFCDISPGEYQIKIKMNYQKSKFSGKRYVLLASLSSLGSASSFLHWTYICVGCVGIVLGSCMLCYTVLHSKKGSEYMMRVPEELDEI